MHIYICIYRVVLISEGRVDFIPENDYIIRPTHTPTPISPAPPYSRRAHLYIVRSFVYPTPTSGASGPSVPVPPLPPRHTIHYYSYPKMKETSHVVTHTGITAHIMCGGALRRGSSLTVSKCIAASRGDVLGSSTLRRVMRVNRAVSGGSGGSHRSPACERWCRRRVHEVGRDLLEVNSHWDFF